MEQLTINHLAPYLPYGLMISARRMNDKDRNFNIGRMCEISNKSNHGNWVMLRHNNVVTVTSNTWNQSTSDMHTYFVPEDEVKPLLRPLYQLTETIEHNGERFVPESIINDIVEDVSMYQYSSDNRFEITKQTPDYSIGIDYYDGYLIMQKLFSWHFDVFGLIKKGLAIPIPSLNS